jgi:hypothetical protein
MTWLLRTIGIVVALGQAAMDRVHRWWCLLTQLNRMGLADPCTDPAICPVGFCYELNGCAGTKLAGGAPMTLKACWLLAGPGGVRSWQEVVWPKTTPDFVVVGARCVSLYRDSPPIFPC